METQFTKGKWEYVGGDNSSVEVNIGETTCNIDRCDKNTGQFVISRGEMNANAKLIAASPEMLEALNETIDLIKWGMNEGHFDDTVYNKVIKVIKKAIE
jgi:hypothetical protein